MLTPKQLKVKGKLTSRAREVLALPDDDALDRKWDIPPADVGYAIVGGQGGEELAIGAGIAVEQAQLGHDHRRASSADPPQLGAGVDPDRRGLQHQV